MWARGAGDEREGTHGSEDGSDHGALLKRLEPNTDEPYDLPADEPLTLAAYAAGPQVEIYLEHLAFGASLAEMALFLRPDRYINVPLEVTYQTAYAGMPSFWRGVLEGLAAS